MNIYIGNLEYGITEDKLKEVFSEFGEVSSVKLITDKYSGQSKGFGFIDMPDNSEADIAISSLNGKAINGRPVKVNEAKPRPERNSRRVSH